MFSERLRSTRKQKQLKLQQMADMLNISLRAYQHYEQAERSPSLEMLVKIADIFDVSTDYLLCRDEFLAKYADEYQINLPLNPKE